MDTGQLVCRLGAGGPLLRVVEIGGVVELVRHGRCCDSVDVGRAEHTAQLTIRVIGIALRACFHGFECDVEVNLVCLRQRKVLGGAVRQLDPAALDDGLAAGIIQLGQLFRQQLFELLLAGHFGPCGDVGLDAVLDALPPRDDEGVLLCRVYGGLLLAVCTGRGAGLCVDVLVQQHLTLFGVELRYRHNRRFVRVFSLHV